MKIIEQVEKAEKEIRKNPYFLSKFLPKNRLYKKSFFRGKHALYYDVLDEKKYNRNHFFQK